MCLFYIKMIPIIHVLCQYTKESESEDSECVDTERKTVFFIIKETTTSPYFYVIGEHIFGNSREKFSLQLTEQGVFSFVGLFSHYKNYYDLVALEEERLCSCPVWNYNELCRRISATALHRLNNPVEQNVGCELDDYLNVVNNSFYESVAYSDADFDPLDYWKGEDW